jgi:hypothetical protein
MVWPITAPSASDRAPDRNRPCRRPSPERQAGEAERQQRKRRYDHRPRAEPVIDDAAGEQAGHRGAAPDEQHQADLRDLEAGDSFPGLVVPSLLGDKILLACVTVAIVVWGVAGWGFFPAQQARLIGIAGVKVAPIVLSLNASSMYLGFSLGAALGSITVIYGSVLSLGWAAAACEMLALAIVLVSTRSARAFRAPASAGAEVAAAAAARCPRQPQAASGCAG